LFKNWRARRRYSAGMRKQSFLFLALSMALAADAGTSTSANLDWLSGHWCARSAERLIEEYWLPAQGDLALGMSRTVEAGKTVSFEFLRIERSGTATNYVAHPQGGPPTAFALSASGADWARFENPQHDFPKRVEYRRTSAGLHAEIAGPGRDGKETVIRFEYRACAG
jgi:hypothetical protein